MLREFSSSAEIRVFDLVRVLSCHVSRFELVSSFILDSCGVHTKADYNPRNEQPRV